MNFLLSSPFSSPKSRNKIMRLQEENNVDDVKSFLACYPCKYANNLCEDVVKKIISYEKLKSKDEANIEAQCKICIRPVARSLFRGF